MCAVEINMHSTDIIRLSSVHFGYMDARRVLPLVHGSMVTVTSHIHVMFDVALQIRGHCVSDLDPLGITQARHAETEEEARMKLLTTYRYHTIYNIGKVAAWILEAVHVTDVRSLMT